MGDLIPNSFQFPNAYVDALWHLLTPEEKSVLVYMARRIFGFGKSSDRISLSQLCNGIRTKEGKQLDHGTGLKQIANQRALDGLITYGIVVEAQPPDYGRRLAAMYELQLSYSEINIDGLEQRAEEWRNRNINRTIEATFKRKCRVTWDDTRSG